MKKENKKKMKVLKCNQPTYFDVDETLVMSMSQNDMEGEYLYVTVPKLDFSIKVRPHKEHIQSLIRHKGRGHTIVVWSAGGHMWAEAVVKALQLEQYVDLVVEKPRWFYDDLVGSEILHDMNRIYRPYKYDK